MANSLTGDFDLVAEISSMAVNRVLAAMHQCERFLHSVSLRVDDNPHPTRPNWPVVVGAVDGFGDAIANQQQIGSPNPFPGASAITDPTLAGFGLVINPDLLVSQLPPITPSHISGVAQLQLFPPVLVGPDAAGANLTVRTNVMTRYFPDKGTARLAEFMRGDLEISAPVSTIAVSRMRVIEIDFKADQANISFTNSYSSQSLSAEDLAGINLCIQNGLRTSFLPSSITLPSNIADVQLRTLPGAIAILLNLNDHASNPASVNNVFLGAGDDFAFAVGRDYLVNTLNSIASNIVSQSIPPATFAVDLGFTTLHYSYPIQLTSALFDIQTNKIVLTIQGNAGPEQNGHPPSSFSFTVTVEFSITVAGLSVSLSRGNVSVSTSSTAANIVDFFTGDITGSVEDAIDAVMANTGAGNTVSTMLDLNSTLGASLNAQLKAADGTPPIDPQGIFLIYRSAEIQPDGIVLRGSLMLLEWPSPYVEFEQIPAVRPNPVLVPTGPDYTALKTWIPGGTITQYEWSVQGQEQAYPFDVDPNRFVLLHSAPEAQDAAVAGAVALPGYSPLCLTITGTRISDYTSPPVYQPVTASVCGVTRFKVGLLPGALTGATFAPTVAAVRPGPSGQVSVTGHAPVETDTTGRSSPNLIVHFAGERPSGLEFLTEALDESKRTDAPTAIIAVLNPDEMTKAKYVPGVIYSDDVEAWQKALRVKAANSPLTLLMNPRGAIAWQQEGCSDAQKLASVLAKTLVKREPVPLGVTRPNVRIGQPVPNFLFEYTAGREMPVRKLAGRPLVLVFWRSSSKPSIQAVRDLQAVVTKGKAAQPMLLGINDGDSPEIARNAAAEAGLTATLVVDPKSEISQACGFKLWPTVVRVNAAGTITGIESGYHSEAHVPEKSEPTVAAL
jgi:peroxiredoxin